MTLVSGATCGRDVGRVISSRHNGVVIGMVTMEDRDFRAEWSDRVGSDPVRCFRVAKTFWWVVCDWCFKGAKAFCVEIERLKRLLTEEKSPLEKEVARAKKAAKREMAAAFAEKVKATEAQMAEFDEVSERYMYFVQAKANNGELIFELEGGKKIEEAREEVLRWKVEFADAESEYIRLGIELREDLKVPPVSPDSIHDSLENRSVEGVADEMGVTIRPGQTCLTSQREPPTRSERSEPEALSPSFSSSFLLVFYGFGFHRRKEEGLISKHSGLKEVAEQGFSDEIRSLSIYLGQDNRSEVFPTSHSNHIPTLRVGVFQVPFQSAPGTLLVNSGYPLSQLRVRSQSAQGTLSISSGYPPRVQGTPSAPRLRVHVTPSPCPEPITPIAPRRSLQGHPRQSL
ncbi:hypothetical protein ISN45_Aa05g009670 [Arabidopsis thaliana x Arabidopsis arenosa]|uniref:Uncharacterized protein n=1 Tax=Arabidopsis thaliana x Arabidopsis arenosa TaxID=1240361 RepID=A0A8T1ZJN3_9BRAS|nr:hypothetical protein ISN45_Aa05g009670 [Arabidopsis thaliana x Arabidopsis arenosa]